MIITEPVPCGHDNQTTGRFYMLTAHCVHSALLSGSMMKRESDKRELGQDLTIGGPIANVFHSKDIFDDS